MNIKYSIIVPIYGVEKYINKCIDSLINQKYENLEIILVDDGSKDNCPKICDDYKKQDNRIIVIHKENGGLVSARQAGAAIASGDYIACVDGDDFVSNDYIEKIDFVIRKNMPDVLCFNYSKVDESNIFIGSEKITNKGFYNRHNIESKIFPFLIEDKNARSFPPALWNKIFKKELYVKCQLLVNQSIKIGEDYACTKVIISKANSLMIIEDKLYNYRISNSAMTKNKTPFSFDVPELIGKHFEKNIDLLNNDFQNQINRLVVHLLFNTCVSAFYEKKSFHFIKSKINESLSKDYYKKVIKFCSYDFKCLKGQIVLFSLKHRCYLLLKIYSKIWRP